MTPGAWDVVAEAAKWAREHSSALSDSHWIGGDPVENEPYGFAGLDLRAGFGVLTLRNPRGAMPGVLTLSLLDIFELPAVMSNASFTLQCRYSSQRNGGIAALTVPFASCPGRQAECAVHASHLQHINLAPFQTVVLHAQVAAP